MKTFARILSIALICSLAGSVAFAQTQQKEKPKKEEKKEKKEEKKEKKEHKKDEKTKKKD
ncbi:MAG: hypothetical protein JSS93_12210 [Bacteroidetes bacterium]|nr:hypothetical protein [Bacteroidota bacterium]MBS1558771.1 hypothetical protein [Bacteroidota bacterium]